MNQRLAVLLVAILSFGGGYFSGNTQSTDSLRDNLSSTKEQVETLRSDLFDKEIEISQLNSRLNAASVTQVPTAPPPIQTPPPQPETELGDCPVTTCNDGSCSPSTGRGTCAYHGGVYSYN